MSGLSHVPGDTMVDPKWTGCSFWFFPAQAIAITAEDYVISVGKRLGIRENLWTCLLGYSWTIAWFSFSAPIFLDWAVKAGLGKDKLTEWSVVQMALDEIADWTGIDVMGWVVTKCRG